MNNKKKACTLIIRANVSSFVYNTYIAKESYFNTIEHV